MNPFVPCPPSIQFLCISFQSEGDGAKEDVGVLGEANLTHHGRFKKWEMRSKVQHDPESRMEARVPPPPSPVVERVAGHMIAYGR